MNKRENKSIKGFQTFNIKGDLKLHGNTLGTDSRGRNKQNTFILMYVLKRIVLMHRLLLRIFHPDCCFHGTLVVINVFIIWNIE